MNSVDPKYIQFEKLGAKIFKELSSKADVKWNDYIWGHNSKTKRQIDVSIKATIEGHEILEIIQLKNWKRKASFTAVDAFASVVKDVRATSGILICKSGFTSQVKKYAKNIGIKLLNLHDAESQDWNLEIKIPVLWTEYSLILHPFSFKFVGSILPGTQITFGPRSKITVSPDNGKTTIDVLPMFVEKWNNWKLDMTPNKKHRFPLPDNLSCHTKLKNGDIVWHTLETFDIYYETKRTKSLFGYFEPKECRGIIDYNQNESFIISHMPPIKELLKMPQKGWQKIADPEKIAVNIKTTLLTAEKMESLEKIEYDLSI